MMILGGVGPVLFGACALLILSAPFFLQRRASPQAHAFYYWKTQWSASPELLASLSKNETSRLYMRFFDVEWDGRALQPRPVSPITFGSPLPQNVETIPVVYLTNEVFLKIPYPQAEILAGKVWDKVSRMGEEHGLQFRELQLDCDWTDTSHAKYFRFAQVLKEKLNKQKIAVSSTIRLHQVKYFERTGIPPVNRGMLMFYNFGRIQADAERSSIFNAEDAKKYSSYIAAYPLNLDVSLPLFSWSVHSREAKVLGLLNKVGSTDIESFDGFARLSPKRYTARRSFFFRGQYFMEGDMLVIEDTSSATTLAAATLAAEGAGPLKSYNTIAFFDLDERNLSNYANTDFKSIYKKFE